VPPPLGAEILPSGWLSVKVIIVITIDKNPLSTRELLLDWSDTFVVVPGIAGSASADEHQLSCASFGAEISTLIALAGVSAERYEGRRDTN
jgi:hypothetical protein